jgi:hypothetical protein
MVFRKEIEGVFGHLYGIIYLQKSTVPALVGTSGYQPQRYVRREFGRGIRAAPSFTRGRCPLESRVPDRSHTHHDILTNRYPGEF